MSPQTATLVFACWILVLFALDRDRNARTSSALWIPVVWLSIGMSRMVSQWLQMAPATSIDQILEGSPLDRNILLGLTVVGIIVLRQRGQKVATLLRANRPILLFFLYCCASVLWSDYPFVAFKRWFKACGDLIIVLIILTDPDPATAIKRLFARLGFLLIPVSILLIKYYPELGRGYENFTWKPFVTGVTTGKNQLGMICFICGFGSVWRLLQTFRDRGDTRRTGPIIAQGTLLAMVLWLFWQADSMTSLLCFLLASAFIVATSLSWLVRKPSVVHLLVVAALSVTASILFFDIGGSVMSSIGRDPTLTGRTEVWEVALRFAGNPLFGTGFESFWLGERLRSIWDIYWWHPNEAHNGYLELFLSLGWTGVALFTLVMITGYRNIVAALQRDPDADRFRLAYFVAFMAYNFTEAAIKGFQPIWVLFLLTIMTVPKDSKLSQTSKDMEPRKSRSFWTASPEQAVFSTQNHAIWPTACVQTPDSQGGRRVVPPFQTVPRRRKW